MDSQALELRDRAVQRAEPPPQDIATNTLAVIARAAADPAVNVEKMRELLAMQFEIMREQQRMQFHDAMARLQPRLPRIAQGGRNTHTGKLYSRYEDIDAGIRKLLNEEGFSLAFDTSPGSEPSMMRVILHVKHVGGHVEMSSLEVPKEKASPSMNLTQAVKSTMTYAKRALVESAFNLVSEGADTDGVYQEPITADQSIEIRDMIRAAGVDEKRFLQAYRIPNVESLPRMRYKEALGALRKRLDERR